MAVSMMVFIDHLLYRCLQLLLDRQLLIDGYNIHRWPFIVSFPIKNGDFP